MLVEGALQDSPKDELPCTSLMYNIFCEGIYFLKNHTWLVTNLLKCVSLIDIKDTENDTNVLKIK